MELKRVVVTGLGAITPVGNSVPEFWENIVNGVSGAGPITHFDASLFKTQFACEVKDFDATKYIDRKEARKMDLYTQYAIAVAKEAVSDSGLDVEKEDLNKIGVIFGAGIGGIHTFEEEVGNYYTRQEMGPKFNPFFIPKMISDIAAGQISIMYGFHGPNYATCSACATSTNAIADAFNLIRLGKANVIVSGGSEAAIFPAGVGGFNAMHALSTRNDEASKASRPFSASRDGFVMGEGGGCLILEELEHAKARGAKIYAEVAGVGMSADAHHLTASHPEGLGAKLVMKNALEDAGMDPKEVDYINVYSFETDSGKADLVSGKVVANLQWSGDGVYSMQQVEEEGIKLRYAVPKASTNLWFDGWCMLKSGIGKDKEKQQAAQAFVNYISRPDNVVRNMYYVGYTSVISGGEDKTIYNYIKYMYGSEDKKSVDYDLNYFFQQNGDNYNYVMKTSEEMSKGQLYAQYPTQDVMRRSAVMTYFGDQANKKISRMWIDMRCFDPRIKKNSK